jgi:hypothetical protein
VAATPVIELLRVQEDNTRGRMPSSKLDPPPMISCLFCSASSICPHGCLKQLEPDGWCPDLDKNDVHMELLDQSDLIIVMEIVQKDHIHRLYPNTKGRVVLLEYFDSVGPLEIADPYGGPIEAFRSCLEQISRCC